MRLLSQFLVLIFLSSLALTQETFGPVQVAKSDDSGTPAAPSTGAVSGQQFQMVKSLIKRELKKAIDGRPYPSVQNWQPLTAREKFDVFLKHTYSPGTFAGAGIDAMKDDFRHKHSEYEQGWRGLGQRAGIELATSESDVFFQRFLIPTVLKQDPRYFRNPSLPLPKRALYSMSRVVITHADNGHNTFNASRIVGGAISQALSDLYVPGLRQGMTPIWNRVSFNLVRDAGFNLVHEFWPDLRKKFLPKW